LRKDAGLASLRNLFLHSLPLRLMKEIIKNIIGKLKDIRDINTEYYEEFIKNNKIEPTWENYYYFYY